MRDGLTVRRFVLMIAIAAVCFAAVAAICVCIGPSGEIGLPRLSSGGQSGLNWSVIELRLLRVLIAAVVGLALATAGVTFQALLRNPLASPYILGISSGASAGVVLGLFLRQYPALRNSILAHAPPTLLALAGALLTIGVVYSLAQRRGRLDPMSLLLVGVMVGAFNGALIMLLNSLLPGDVRADFVLWMMGMISEDRTWIELAWIAGGIAVAVVVQAMLSHQFNVQSLGEETARSLGIRVASMRLVSFAAASIATALAVSITGPIGFVGLICPHICRRLFGVDHRVLIVTAAALGAIFLLVCDTGVRAAAAASGGEIPLGAITALFGGPFFIYLLRQHKWRGEA